MTINILTIPLLAFCILLIGCHALPVPQNGIEVDFSNITQETDPISTFKLPFKITPSKTEELKEVKIDGVLAYHIAWQLQQPIKKDIFNRIKDYEYSSIYCELS